MNLRFLNFFVVLLLFVACEETPGASQQGNPGSLSDSNPAGLGGEQEKPQSLSPSTQRGTKSSMDCVIEGQRIEDNELWIKDQGLYIGILADSTTFEPDFGHSHRILSVYDTDSCTQIYRKTLPVNFSPDFPYYLNIKMYEAKNGLICAQGFEDTYCFDIKNRKALPALKPKYLSERIGVDAQSGMPQGLELNGNYLFGLAQDYGVFAYDLSDPENPVALLPAAEYTSPDENVYPLFFVPDGQDTYQAMTMKMNEEETATELVKIFEKPMPINPVLPKQIQNNRFIVLNAGEQRLAIDMKEQKALPLPEDIASKPVQDILKWLRKNR